MAYDATNFTINRLTKYIKDIISEKTYNIENFNKLIEENQTMKLENERLNTENHILNNKISTLDVEINELKELVKCQENSLKLLNEEEAQTNNDNNIISPKEVDVKDELTLRFDQFINESCVIRDDVEVDSCDIIAQFRIWNRVKPKRETNERFNRYLRTRFLATRLQNQDKDQCVHGFVGLMLKPIEYKKTLPNDLVETFIFETCHFSPNNRIPNKKLEEEFTRYKNKMGIDII